MQQQMPVQPLFQPEAILWKRVENSKFLGARRVGGEGSNHAGSHWVRVAAPVVAHIPEHGPRPTLVLSHTPNQVKVFATGLGTFGVHPTQTAPSQHSVEWNRREALATTPAVGSLVNVRRAGDESQWMGKILEPLHNKSEDEPVLIERGAPGRPAQQLSVLAKEVLGPHIPTKIKSEEGGWVKDALRRRSEVTSPLDGVVSRDALEATAPALEWPRYLPTEQQQAMQADEERWFLQHGEEVRQVARAQARRLRLSSASAGEVEAEALRGALAALRLWTKAPDAAREMTIRKLAKENPIMDASALSDDELRTQRAMWRAFAHARTTALSFLPKVGKPAPIPDSQVMNIPSVVAPSDSPVNAAVAALAPVADAANLSGAARFLLLNALHLGHGGHVALETEGAPWPTVEGEEVASKLRELFGVPHATVDSLPGMWLYVRNRLSDAVRDNPSLYPMQDGPLVKGVFAAFILETTVPHWAERATHLFKSVGGHSGDFQEWKHPRNHGRFIHKHQFAFHPAPLMFAMQGSGGGTSRGGTPPSGSPTPPPIPSRGILTVPQPSELKKVSSNFSQWLDPSGKEMKGQTFEQVEYNAAVAIAQRMVTADVREVHALIQLWNGKKTSASGRGRDAGLVALQVSANAVFGGSIGHLSDDLRRTDVQDLLIQKGDFYRQFLLAMYALTQEQLSAHGLTEFTLWRGEDRMVSGETEGVTTAPLELQPLSSFTYSFDQSVSFSQEDQGSIILVKAPASRIVSVAPTGFGSLRQREQVVIGASPTGIDEAVVAQWKTPEVGSDYREAEPLDWLRLLATLATGD